MHQAFLEGQRIEFVSQVTYSFRDLIIIDGWKQYYRNSKKGDREYDLSEGSGFGWHVGRVIAKECRVFETASMLELMKRSHHKVACSCYKSCQSPNP